VVFDATGSFVVTWAGNLEDENFGVAAQRYGNPRTPIVGSLGDTPDPVGTGDTVALSASDVSSFDATVTRVSFYRESNGDAGLQVGAEGDTLVGTATTNVGGVWSVNASIAGLAAGTYTYWAQATDTFGLTGAAGSTTNTILGAPAVAAASFGFRAAPHVLRFTFDQNVSASLGTDDIVLENLTSSTMIPSSDLALSYNATSNTATFSYIGNAAGISGVLPDGNYRATLLASGITSSNGTPMTADYVLDFFFLNGDAAHDGRVNLNDFNILAANFGQEPRDFTQGDFSYDGRVNLNDFNILASRFGTVLAAPGAGASSNSSQTRFGNGDDEITDDDLLA
jgi:hypothetical protein